MALRETRRESRCAGVALMERYLEALGLGPTYTTRAGIEYRTLPEGLGWCQVLYAPEEAWPPGADFCVVVRWHPGKAFRRDSRTGAVPAGAETHWKERTQATVSAPGWGLWRR
ncbi:hypothetical protein AB0D94_28335 [Streptomyces sp. NPDC048255]|uniref:hypothetical protein n=1 Tax=Streptomyces sp. NPDC048255 TaxID=3154713 RepID=UPI0033DBD543